MSKQVVAYVIKCAQNMMAPINIVMCDINSKDKRKVMIWEINIYIKGTL